MTINPGLIDLLGDRASAVSLSPAEIQRYARHLIMPEVAMEGQKRLKAVEGSLHRDRRAGFAADALPGRGRSRHARAGRFRRRRRLEPPAPDHPLHLRRRPAQGRQRPGEAPGDQPRPERRPSRASDRQQQRAGDLRRLRRDRGRHRQLPDALPGQRRLRPAGQAERLRLDLPVRRPGVGVLPAARPVLSLPLPRAAAARPRAQLRRGGRAGHPAGLDRRRAGDRDGQAPPGSGPPADRPAAALRRARHDRSAR